MLSENLARVRARIQYACQRCGRDPASVTVVCVTKGIALEAIQEAVSLGVADLGENRIQEARAKQLALGSQLDAECGVRNAELPSKTPHAALSTPHSSVRWHLIGHLQRNKAKLAVALFDVIHSVDSVELVEELERHVSTMAPGSGLRARGTCPQPSALSPERLQVFIQVNISGEATKFGCTPEEAPSLAQAIGRLPHLRLVGLMTMAPFVEHPEQARPYFRRLRLLRDAIVNTCHLSPVTCHLSMGMSNDFEVAIEEGADVVRIGSAIFGARTP